MSREIKFRQAVFDGKGAFEGFHYWGFVGLNYVGAITDVNNTIEQAQERSQQYTGLKDANGVEIFEGDIIQSEDSGGRSVRHVIEWVPKEGGFGCVLVGIDRRWNGVSAGVRQSWLDEFDKEVCGNIYENPELLD